MKPLAIIPVKAKSTRLPDKNIKKFLGKPIYEHTVWAAINSKLFDRIIITTDIPQIKQHKKLLDSRVIDIIDRPHSLATEEATIVDVCVDVLKKYPAYKVFCCLLPTAPMRTATDIEIAYKYMLRLNHEGVMGVTKFIQPWWQALYDEQGVWKPFLGRNLLESREDKVGIKVVDNGSMYWCNVKAFLKQKTFYLDKLGVLIMPYECSIDINTEIDFELAEFFAKKSLKI